MSKSDLVVKSNQLNSALQNLSLTEIRIIQLAIVDARETNTGLSTDKPLRIEAKRYAGAFNVSLQTASEAILAAEETLFSRRFSYVDDSGLLVKSRWIQDVRYMKGEGAIEIAFTRAVVQGISRIDGAVDFFTQYLLSQTATMKSMYSIRLYELLVQWKAAKNTPIFEIKTFRSQLGIIGADEYKRMGDFKKRVLDLGVKEINEKSDLTVAYKQHKKGSTISGFSFTVKEKEAAKPKSKEAKDPKNYFFKFTDKALATFSTKLANLDALGSSAPIGKSTVEFAAIIAKDLQDETNQKKYIKYLKELGYKFT